MRWLRKARSTDAEAKAMTPDAIRDRLEEAAQTLRALPARGCFPTGMQAAWPETTGSHYLDWVSPGEDDFRAEKSRWEAEHNQVRTAPPKPDPKAIERMDEAIRWFFLVDDELDRKVLFARCLGFSLRRIGREIGLSHVSVRSRERDAMDEILRSLSARRQKSALQT